MRKLEVRIQIVFEVEIHKHTDKYMKALMHMFYYISNIASKEKWETSFENYIQSAKGS